MPIDGEISLKMTEKYSLCSLQKYFHGLIVQQYSILKSRIRSDRIKILTCSLFRHKDPGIFHSREIERKWPASYNKT